MFVNVSNNIDGSDRRRISQFMRIICCKETANYIINMKAMGER